MRFALVAGKSLEQQLDEWLAEGKSKEVADCLLSFAEQLKNLPGRVCFRKQRISARYLAVCLMVFAASYASGHGCGSGLPEYSA